MVSCAPSVVTFGVGVQGIVATRVGGSSRAGRAHVIEDVGVGVTAGGLARRVGSRRIIASGIRGASGARHASIVGHALVLGADGLVAMGVDTAGVVPSL